MIETFYLHIEFSSKKGNWSINLPFLCDKCGVCCTLDDFLTAGEVKANPKENPQVYAKIKALFDELGKMFEADPEKYEHHVTTSRCPFQINNLCSIYEIRPDGCRLFPGTKFGMLSQDCQSLKRYKKQRSALKKGKVCKEKPCFTKDAQGKCDIPIKPANLTETQYQTCINKLQKAGITKDELTLFNSFNKNSVNKKS
jgi:Fe-S-cluster containining protein